jgi:hypothetical protein
MLCEIRKKNTSNTCAVFSEAYGGEAMKSNAFLSGINGSKRVTRTWNMMEEVVVQDLTEPVRMLKNYAMWCIQINVHQSYNSATKF